MKIRSLTYFLNPGYPVEDARLRQAGEFIAAARPAFQAAGYEVQTARLATIPFPSLCPSLDLDRILHLAVSLENAAQEAGFDYVSLGPALPDAPLSYSRIPAVLAETQNVFLGGMLTIPGGGISLPAVRQCAEVIHATAPISPDGFTNLRFAALANVPPGAPFFPAAYHAGDRPTFAIATESADLAVEAFSQADNLEDARNQLVQSVERHAQALAGIAENFTWQFNLPFSGIDFTLAPFPEASVSLGTAIEQMGVPSVGLHGSLAAAAILADTLDRARFPRVGFNGLMLPVLEDAILARRASEGRLSVKDLLLYSTVCGTGLDTLPLPGDTSTEQIYAVLLDLAVLSQRLDKPLTARLMPIPGKIAGDPTGFDFTYFANSRVLALEADSLVKHLRGEDTFSLASRHANLQ